MWIMLMIMNAICALGTRRSRGGKLSLAGRCYGSSGRDALKLKQCSQARRQLAALRRSLVSAQFHAIIERAAPRGGRLAQRCERPCTLRGGASRVVQPACMRRALLGLGVRYIAPGACHTTRECSVI